MVRLLKDLKVAEVRKYLTEKGESSEGKKPILLQVRVFKNISDLFFNLENEAVV